MAYKVGIVGLGRIASTFDEDPSRKVTWTHAGAYREVPQTELVAASDIDSTKLNTFGEKWGVKSLYENFEEMLKKENLDIVSVCTPEDSHAQITIKAAESGAKAVFCEKPMAVNLEEADKMIQACNKNNVKLIIDHYKRREELFKKAKELLDSGKIGELTTIVGYYSSEIMNIGTHLFDLLRFYTGDASWVTASVRTGDEKDPGEGGFIMFKNGVHGHVVERGGKDYLIFEIDLLGTNGRIRILENGKKLELWTVKQSEKYSDCKELFLEQTLEESKEKSWMIEAVKDVVECIVQDKESEVANAKEGKAALELAIAFNESEKNNNSKVELPLKTE